MDAPEQPLSASPALRERRRLHRRGVLVIALAIIGVVVSVIASAIAWNVLGQIDETSTRTLAVTVESLDAAENTIELADGVLGSTSATVDAVEDTLQTLATSTRTGTGVVDSIGDLARTAGPAFDDAEETLRDLAEVGGSIDQVLAAVTRLPFGLRYQPEAGFGATMGELATELEPLPGAFAAATVELESFSDSTEDVQAEVEALALSVSAIGDRIDDRTDLVDQYRRSIASAREVGEQSARDLESSLRFAQIAIVAVGLVFAAGQVVPYLYGREQLARARSLHV